MRRGRTNSPGMDDKTFALVQRAVSDALEQPETEWATIVARVCGDDRVASNEARSLLGIAARSGGDGDLFCDTEISRRRLDMDAILPSQEGFEPRSSSVEAARAMDEHGDADAPGFPSGTRIGAFTISGRLGAGGMGTVYAATQDHPRRQVALKVINAAPTPALIRRFQAEAEALGRLRHHGIAQIYGAGVEATPFGAQPYIAMELVEGESFDAFVVGRQLTQDALLELMAHISDAVQHAHLKGIVHRDLKPDNILVTPEGRPKILDFGIARFSDDSTLAATMMTREGQVLGTLAYMAPEQLAATPEAIGPASDVYALGVMLFEQLCGHLPLKLSGMSISAALRAVEMDEPARVRSVDRTIPRDLDTIVNRCLERDPTRRYRNAGALADDVRRYLGHEPIVARPPTTRYRAAKFIRRNALLVGGVTATVLALMIGLVATGYFAAGQREASLVAQRERTQARSNEIDAIAGVLAGASVLADRGEPWEGVRQLMAVSPESRGWEWRHTALSLPWVVDHEHMRSTLAEAGPAHVTGFVSDTELLKVAPDSGRIWVIDVFTGARREVPLGPNRAFRAAVGTSPEGTAGLLLHDGRAGSVDLQSGAFTEWMPTVRFLPDGESLASLIMVNADASIAVTIVQRELVVYFRGREVYRAPSAARAASSMAWRRPIIDPANRWLLLPDSGSPGRVTVLETATWTTNTITLPRVNDPRVVVSEDGSRAYVNSDRNGVDVYAVPSFELLETIMPESGTVNFTMVSHELDLLVYSTKNPGTLRVHDSGLGEDVWAAPIGANLQRTPLFAPGGRLARLLTPEQNWSWIVDVDRVDTIEPGRPFDGNPVTTLTQHRSWVYQLAVSPDGSLLASAEPAGDILLWDLRSDRLLTRVPRASSRQDAMLVHNMNAPLVFSPDGTALVFGERDPESGAMGVTRVDLSDGSRTWEETGSREGTLDAVAAVIPAGKAAPLYHHAARLADGRVLQSNAVLGLSSTVEVRDPRDGSMVPIRSGRLTYTGVAAHPDGSVYAAGEYLMVRIRDARNDEVLFELPDGSESRVYGLAYSPDGSRLAMGTEDGRVMIFETEFYKKLAQIRMPDNLTGTSRNYVYSLVWSPDGTRLITTGNSALRILESERVLQREQRRVAWVSELELAWRVLDGSAAGADRAAVSEAALRVVHIERWGREPRDVSPEPGTEG